MSQLCSSVLVVQQRPSCATEPPAPGRRLGALRLAHCNQNSGDWRAAKKHCPRVHNVQTENNNAPQHPEARLSLRQTSTTIHSRAARQHDAIVLLYPTGCHSSAPACSSRGHDIQHCVHLYSDSSRSEPGQEAVRGFPLCVSRSTYWPVAGHRGAMVTRPKGETATENCGDWKALAVCLPAYGLCKSLYSSSAGPRQTAPDPRTRRASTKG